MKTFPSLIEEGVSSKVETGAEKEKRMRQELISKGQQFEEVKFSFIEPKFKISADKLPASLNWQLFSANLPAEEKEKISFMYNQLINFLGADIITDSFKDSEDLGAHDHRGKWERDYLDQLSPETRNYYKNNRLGLTNATRPKVLFDYLTNLQQEFDQTGEVCLNPILLGRIEALVSIMPEELKSGDIYGKIELDHKIKVVNKVAPIFSAIVQMLGEKPVDNKN
jgi:hypothetical protein